MHTAERWSDAILVVAGVVFGAVSCAVAGGTRQDKVIVTAAASVVSIENARVRVAYDLSKGTYSAVDKQNGAVGISNACTRVNELRSDVSGARHTSSSRPTVDALGEGQTLIINSALPDRPSLVLEITLYRDTGFVVLAAGIDNTTARDVQIKELHPCAGAEPFPGLGSRKEMRTLDGFGGAGATRVSAGPSRTSANNLLLTLPGGGQRRSLVLGGLTYHEFLKFARVERADCTDNSRREQLAARLGSSARLAVYVDCGPMDADGAAGGPQLRVVTGTPYQWPDAATTFAPRYGSVAFDSQAVACEASGLDPRKSYVLGFSWWDYDDNGRIQSVTVGAEDGKRATLLARQALPAHLHRNAPPEEGALLLPQDAYPAGKTRILFTNDGGTPNAVVSEVWLWEIDGATTLPAEFAAGTPAASLAASSEENTALAIDLWASDPVGKRVAAQTRYVPEDKFYLDYSTADPFQALEEYGRRLAAAQSARPNPYDFPTVCAWYVGLFANDAAKNRPEKSKYLIATTPGLVEEMDQIAKSGFFKYSRAAVRLVPDKYDWTEPKGLTEQGWWDDEHWAQYGHYMAPYETTAKYGEAIRSRGGLPFTYFQLIGESPDFRQAHAEMLLGNDPQRGLDYSDPATQAHMRKVFSNLRAGGIAGMMFDYPDDCWSTQCVRGWFEDRTATAASVYRTIFALAKEGLGRDSWIHERVLGDPLSDITIGVVDSQRVWGDTSAVSAEMISRCGLRWYKNRVVYAYDMDAKDLLRGWKSPGFAGTDQDGRRMLLTMAYVAASRLLLANSFRDLPPDVLYDLERTFPYPTAPRSARPVDAFVCGRWPQVYDFAISPQWHELTLYNNVEPARDTEISVPLSGDSGSGALGLEANGEYYVYDFWNDRFVGRLKGDAQLEQALRPGEARVLSVHRVEPHPQFLSTNRHIMQGYGDLVRPAEWNESAARLAGTSRVAGGETYELVIATNGWRPLTSTASAGTSRVRPLAGAGDLAMLSLDCPQNADIDWAVVFERVR